MPKAIKLEELEDEAPCLHAYKQPTQSNQIRISRKSTPNPQLALTILSQIWKLYTST